MLRRLFLLRLCLASVLASVLAAVLWASPPQPARAQARAPVVLTVEEAHRRALKGELVLIDIRRPSEWRHTGLPASGHAISMYQGGMQFLVGVLQAAGGDRSKPIALICATGARSAYIQGVLRRHGFSAVSNVAAGMEGGRYGRGWVRSGLPVRPWTGRNAAPTPPAR